MARGASSGSDEPARPRSRCAAAAIAASRRRGGTRPSLVASTRKGSKVIHPSTRLAAPYARSLARTAEAPRPAGSDAPVSWPICSSRRQPGKPDDRTSPSALRISSCTQGRSRRATREQLGQRILRGGERLVDGGADTIVETVRHGGDEAVLRPEVAGDERMGAAGGRGNVTQGCAVRTGGGEQRPCRIQDRRLTRQRAAGHAGGVWRSRPMTVGTCGRGSPDTPGSFSPALGSRSPTVGPGPGEPRA